MSQDPYTPPTECSVCFNDTEFTRLVEAVERIAEAISGESVESRLRDLEKRARGLRDLEVAVFILAGCARHEHAMRGWGSMTQDTAKRLGKYLERSSIEGLLDEMKKPAE